MVSFQNLHATNIRATTDQYMFYKHSLQLYKVFKYMEPLSIGWLTLISHKHSLAGRRPFMHSNQITIGWAIPYCVTS